LGKHDRMSMKEVTGHLCANSKGHTIINRTEQNRHFIQTYT